MYQLSERERQTDRETDREKKKKKKKKEKEKKERKKKKLRKKEKPSAGLYPGPDLYNKLTLRLSQHFGSDEKDRTLSLAQSCTLRKLVSA